MSFCTTTCPLRSRCGWFAPNINDWPRWNPTHFTGEEDPLEVVFTRAAEEGTEDEVAAQREARTRELRRYREERNQARCALQTNSSRPLLLCSRCGASC